MVYQLLGSAHYTGRGFDPHQIPKGVIIRKMYYLTSAVVWQRGYTIVFRGIRQPWEACHVSLSFHPLLFVEVFFLFVCLFSFMVCQ